MLATFAFDVCHDVYQAAREAIDSKIPTLNAESSGKYQWHPDRMPRLAEYVCDFALAGERALGGDSVAGKSGGRRAQARPTLFRGSAAHGALWDRICEAEFRGGPSGNTQRTSHSGNGFRAGAAENAHRASRMTMFRLYYLGGAEYHAARRQMGISELTWADWAEEIRRSVGRELTRAGVFPPSKYFREASAKAS